MFTALYVEYPRCGYACVHKKSRSAYPHSKGRDIQQRLVIWEELKFHDVSSTRRAVAIKPKQTPSIYHILTYRMLYVLFESYPSTHTKTSTDPCKTSIQLPFLFGEYNLRVEYPSMMVSQQHPNSSLASCMASRQGAATMETSISVCLIRALLGEVLRK
jgi:hypothetical protein